MDVKVEKLPAEWEKFVYKVDIGFVLRHNDDAWILIKPSWQEFTRFVGVSDIIWRKWSHALWYGPDIGAIHRHLDRRVAR